VTAVLLRYVIVTAVLLNLCRDNRLTDICDRDRRFICEYGHENIQSYVANQQTDGGIVCSSYIINEVPI